MLGKKWHGMFGLASCYLGISSEDYIVVSIVWENLIKIVHSHDFILRQHFALHKTNFLFVKKFVKLF